MSKLQTNQLQHTANGAAVYTLPQTDGSAGQVLQTNGSGVLSWVTLPSGGLTVAQTFRVTSNVATNNSTIVFESNWEKADDASAGSLGSFADPNSSGVFTFPSTGIYYVTFTSYFEDSGYNTNAYVQIQATTDNSNWDTVSSTHFGTTYDQSGNNYQSGFVNALIDVTSTTNVKVRFRAYSNSTVSWDTSDSQNRTAATFLRLGDT
jgi:hypothetical protein